MDAGSIRDEFAIPLSLFLFRPSADSMRPAHVNEGEFLYEAYT
jgi:hypothetical protein